MMHGLPKTLQLFLANHVIGVFSSNYLEQEWATCYLRWKCMRPCACS